MLAIDGDSSQLCDGISRREWLRIGGIGLGGLSLPSLLRAQGFRVARRAAPNRQVGHCSL